MDPYQEDRLESIDIQASRITEITLVHLGWVLYKGLLKASRVDEVELLIDSIGEYSTMVSYYGQNTNRFPESMGVDLNEAALLKRSSLIDGSNNDWQKFSEQFHSSLKDISADLDIQQPLLPDGEK